MAVVGIGTGQVGTHRKQLHERDEADGTLGAPEPRTVSVEKLMTADGVETVADM